ncbi:hypothetical protein HDV05_000116 [Chytridiales sp. JEL 0842]|nr:hypothetical protein HDV05_000116 [Chytridiales sp. JEL 0842]
MLSVPDRRVAPLGVPTSNNGNTSSQILPQYTVTHADTGKELPPKKPGFTSSQQTINKSRTFHDKIAVHLTHGALLQFYKSNAINRFTLRFADRANQSEFRLKYNEKSLQYQKNSIIGGALAVAIYSAYEVVTLRTDKRYSDSVKTALLIGIPTLLLHITTMLVIDKMSLKTVLTPFFAYASSITSAIAAIYLREYQHMRIFMLENFLKEHMGDQFHEEICKTLGSLESFYINECQQAHSSIMQLAARVPTTILKSDKPISMGERLRNFLLPLIRNPHHFKLKPLETLYVLWRNREFVNWLKFSGIIFLSTALYHPFMDYLAYCDDTLLNKSPSLCLSSRDATGFMNLRMALLGGVNVLWTVVFWFWTDMAKKPWTAQRMCTLSLTMQCAILTYVQ